MTIWHVVVGVVVETVVAIDTDFLFAQVLALDDPVVVVVAAAVVVPPHGDFWLRHLILRYSLL
jgi:putative effector of murein hydrolase